MNFAEALRSICGRCKHDEGTCRTCPVFTVVEETESEAYVEHLLQLIRSLKYTKDASWYTGTIGGYPFQIKVASEDSPYGISNGRIIKLFVIEKPVGEHPGQKAVICYERGWSIRPKDNPELDNVLDALFEYFQNHVDEEV